MSEAACLRWIIDGVTIPFVLWLNGVFVFCGGGF
jgi:hypothetical protein